MVGSAGAVSNSAVSSLLQSSLVRQHRKIRPVQLQCSQLQKPSALPQACSLPLHEHPHDAIGTCACHCQKNLPKLVAIFRSQNVHYSRRVCTPSVWQLDHHRPLSTCSTSTALRQLHLQQMTQGEQGAWQLMMERVLYLAAAQKGDHSAQLRGHQLHLAQQIQRGIARLGSAGQLEEDLQHVLVHFGLGSGQRGGLRAPQQRREAREGQARVQH